MNKAIIAYIVLAIASVTGAINAFNAEGYDRVFYFYIANSSAFFAIVIYLFSTKVNPLLRARRVHIEQQLDASAKHLRVAQAKKRDIEERIESLGREKIELIEAHEDEGRRMSAVIVHNAELAAERIREDAKRQIANEHAQLSKELHQQAITQAIAKARARLEHGFTADDDRKLRRAVVESAFNA